MRPVHLFNSFFVFCTLRYWGMITFEHFPTEHQEICWNLTCCLKIPFLRHWTCLPLLPKLIIFPVPSGNNCGHRNKTIVKLKKMRDTLVSKATNKVSFLLQDHMQLQDNTVLKAKEVATCLKSHTKNVFLKIVFGAQWSSRPQLHVSDDPFGKKCSPNLVKLPQLSILPPCTILHPFHFSAVSSIIFCLVTLLQRITSLYNSALRLIFLSFHFLTGRWQSYRIMKESQDAPKLDVSFLFSAQRRHDVSAEPYSRQFKCINVSTFRQAILETLGTHSGHIQ